MKKIKKKNACDGKQRHATEKEARAHEGSLRRLGAIRLNVYRCKFCQGGWHVGHMRRSWGR